MLPPFQARKTTLHPSFSPVNRTSTRRRPSPPVNSSLPRRIPGLTDEAVPSLIQDRLIIECPAADFDFHFHQLETVELAERG